MNELGPMPGCSIERITPDGPGFLHIAAHGTRPGGRCPDCGRASRAVHSRYHRRPADLPSLGRSVGVELRVRRFDCREAACARRTFAERLPEPVAPHARRTRPAGRSKGGSASRWAARPGRGCPGLGMPASAERCCAASAACRCPSRSRRGRSAWTTGRCAGAHLRHDPRRPGAPPPLDLLPDRTATTLADWLRRRPTIEIVARDRSTEYARGTAPARRRRPRSSTAGTCCSTCGRRSSAGWPGRTPGSGACRPSRRRRAARRGAPAPTPHPGGGGRQRRPPRAAAGGVRGGAAAAPGRRGAARDRPGDGPGARDGAASSRTPGAFPSASPGRSGPSILDPYLAHLEARRAAGCENAMALWRELRALGFAGTHRQVQRWLADRRTAPAKSAPRRRRCRRARAPRRAGAGRRAGGAPLAEGSSPGSSCSRRRGWPRRTPRPSRA